MRYRPVRIVCFYSKVFKKLPNGIEAFIRDTPRRYQVRSNLLGNCGHEHKSEKAAEPCFKRMEKMDTRLRSERSKAMWTRLRTARALRKVVTRTIHEGTSLSLTV